MFLLRLRMNSNANIPALMSSTATVTPTPIPALAPMLMLAGPGPCGCADGAGDGDVDPEVGGAVIGGAPLPEALEDEPDVEVDAELDVGVAEVGTYPSCHCTAPPRAEGRLATAGSIGASVKAIEVVRVHVHESADVRVVGFPCCVQADHRFPPLQVTRPTHGASTPHTTSNSQQLSC